MAVIDVWMQHPTRRYYPLYAECIELDVPFCLQVGHTGPLMSSEPGRPIPYLEHVALEFPELRIVAGHIGAPWTQEIISPATKFPNVHIDTSAYKVKRYLSDADGPGEKDAALGRAEALRRAQLALGGDRDTSHPFYWAPFVLVGDGGVIAP